LDVFLLYFAPKRYSLDISKRGKILFERSLSTKEEALMPMIENGPRSRRQREEVNEGETFEDQSREGGR